MQRYMLHLHRSQPQQQQQPQQHARRQCSLHRHVFELPVDAMDTAADVQLNLDSDIALLDVIVPESAEVAKPMVMDDEMDEQIPFLL